MGKRPEATQANVRDVRECPRSKTECTQTVRGDAPLLTQRRFREQQLPCKILQKQPCLCSRRCCRPRLAIASMAVVPAARAAAPLEAPLTPPLDSQVAAAADQDQVRCDKCRLLYEALTRWTCLRLSCVSQLHVGAS